MILDRLVGIFGLIFVAAIAARIYLVSKKINRSPVAPVGGGTAHDYVHKLLAVVIALQALNIVAFRLQEFMPDWPVYAAFIPLSALQTPAVQAVGLALAFLGLAWSVVAQTQMGRSWRIGNREQDDTDLIRHGLYTVSRHPIYVGFITIAVGIFLATPNVLSLLCAVLTLVVLSILARMEEEFQVSRHGAAYKEFMSRTRRWI
jgi:protein-S-isoprenylcysteine O-methyltransferase Ste14